LRKQKLLQNYLWITMGSIVIALALDVFLVPSRIAAGGVSGLATIVYHLLMIPVGVTMLVINIPLFILSFRELGKHVFVRSIYGALATSAFIELLANRVPVMTGDVLLASIYGGIFSGIGIGIVLRAGGTSGGTDLVARSRILRSLSPATFCSPSPILFMPKRNKARPPNIPIIILNNYSHLFVFANISP
jgi:uncharacterized membrane-anchored protein YitT (DUF2179 family)